MIVKGLFVTFEGADGTGKTTISKAVQKKIEEYFNDANRVVYTREPGGTDVGNIIRDILVKYDVDPRTEALLFAASRAELTWKNIMVNKAKNKIVLCDRYVHSSLVYQGIVQNLGYKNVSKINRFAISELKPDIIFYLHLNEKESAKRNDKSHSNGLNNPDKQPNDKLNIQFGNEEKMKKVINGYFSILKFDNKNVFKIDASKSIEEITNKIFDIIIARAVRNDK